MTFDQHLAHLLWLLKPPFTYHWGKYAVHRAQEIAQEREDCTDLPALIRAEYSRLRDEKNASASTS